MDDPGSKIRRRTISVRLVRQRWTLAIAGALIAMVAYPFSSRMSLDRDITSMFSPGDPSLVAYRRLLQTFGGNAVVMLVYADPDLASADGIARNRQIGRQVASIEGVAGILSPAVLDEAVNKIRPSSFLSTSKQPALFRNNNIARGFSDMFAGYTHSADHRRAAVVAMLKPEHNPQTIISLRKFADELSSANSDFIGKVSLVGEPVLVHEGFALIERDGTKLAVLTLGLLSLVVIFTLLDWRFVALAAALIGWSVTITRASLWAMGVQLSLVSTILTAIVTVIAVTAVLHLGVRYHVLRRRRKPMAIAAAGSLGALGVPIFWTCATDAAGFIALEVSQIVPVQQFGIMIAIASCAVFVGALLFSPFAMMMPRLLPKPEDGLGAWLAGPQRWLRRRCMAVAAFSVHHRTLCIVCCLLCFVLAAVGLRHTETESSFLKNFRAGSRIAIDYDEVETGFGGAGVWDIVLDAPAELSEDYLQQVRELEVDLRAIEVRGASLTKAISLADADAIAAKAGLLKLVSPSTRLAGMKVTMPVFFDALLSDPMQGQDHRKLRIMLRSKEHLETDQKIALIDAVEQKVKSSAVGASNSAVSVGTQPVTGYYVLMARLIDHLLGDQWRCFFASGCLVWLLLIVASRSWKLATAALLPNLLPAMLVLAMAGVLGERINMGAAMIAAVSIGLSIDGSVHFLAAYRRHRLREHAARSAAVHAAGSIGVAVLLATVALVVGFGGLVTSEFVPTATFGTLVAFTLLIGTTVNLTLLPAMISWVDRPFRD